MCKQAGVKTSIQLILKFHKKKEKKMIRPSWWALKMKMK